MQRFEGDRAPARRRIQDEPPTPRRRVRTAMSRTRAAVALGVTLAVLGVGTAFGLRASGSSNHDAPKPPAANAAALIQR